ncbi:unnamed protein product [Arabidopsis thaliana]|uniref:(thale cress) hypothetical protein n=1 Tax=Arabidopsis thaliana TaxID=3702 RepID=A0A654F022_ARATH|nr:unnamed protein product [Arabidopsis thaliana]CAD5319161.1 unnamed protein product [Arabidopsis thaliana]VYS53112.1 unnamed protein product [Arabidopsis thaliana]
MPFVLITAMEKQRSKKTKISDDLITCSGNSVQIPFDLIPEILKRLPVKTLARFLSVSKEYTSIIRNRDFMKSYLINSSTRPQSLIFTIAGGGIHCFFSLIDQGESTSSSKPTYLMNCPHLQLKTFAPSVHGLICHEPPSTLIVSSPRLIVSNPSTRRSIILPKIDANHECIYHHMGYDPIDGDYKVLCMMKGMHVYQRRYLAKELQVFTLRKGNSWRMVEDFPPHCLCHEDTPDLCINGVLYYVAMLDTASIHAVMSFDVRSEKFDLIKGGPDGDLNPKLTRYEGKPALLFPGSDYRINLWVIEDAAKHEWSKMSYDVSSTSLIRNPYFHHCVFCTNDAGEIVLAPDFVRTKTFVVLYYHPKKNTMRSVVIKGIRDRKIPLWDEASYHRIISVFSGQDAAKHEWSKKAYVVPDFFPLDPFVLLMQRANENDIVRTFHYDDRVGTSDAIVESTPASPPRVRRRRKKNASASQLVVYSSSTRRSITLPEIDSQSFVMKHFLCYDPIDSVYKVLCMTGPWWILMNLI